MSNSTNNSLQLRQVKNTDLKSLIQLLDIRNEAGVRKWMYSDHVIELNEHLKWISTVKECHSTLAFVIQGEHDEVLGMLKLDNIDSQHKSADWAFYLGENSRGGLGAPLEFYFIDFVFDKLDLEKLNCEVIEGNDKVIRLHKKYLFKEEGFRASNIIKEGKRKGVHFLGLTRENWLAGKDEIYEKFKKSFDKVNIIIDWHDESIHSFTDLNPIDKIEAARARNNLNWMNILRLALEESPNEGRRLVEDIRNIDKEISSLTDMLLETESFSKKLNVSRSAS